MISLVIVLIFCVGFAILYYLWYNTKKRLTLLQKLYGNIVRTNTYNEQVNERLRIENRVLHLRIKNVKD